MNGQYSDKSGFMHICRKKISEGGQGAVYRTNTPNVVIKLAQEDHKVIMDEKLNQQYNDIRLLPIPEGLHITLPLETLQGVSGYVMTLLDDMNCFEDVFLEAAAPEGFTTPWLTEMAESAEGEDVLTVLDMLRQYIATGGRRRRLEAFFKCACILAQLHGAGLIYCDISGKNLFISTNAEFSEVWLIDADNLAWEAERSADPGFITPGFGAPELVSGKGGNSCYSDCYSFAIALFWILYGTHPFDGQGAFDEDGDYCEEWRNSGDLPWIFDEKDTSNALEAENLPYSNFVSTRLNALFTRMFSEGRYDPKKRPLMPEWAYALGAELDHTVRCHHCGMDFDGLEFDQCPWCDSALPVLKTRSFIDEAKHVLFWESLHEMDDGAPVIVPLRLVNGVQTADTDEILFRVRRADDTKGRLKLDSFHNGWRFADAEKGTALFGEALVPDKFCIVCENNDRRFWIEVYLHETA